MPRPNTVGLGEYTDEDLVAELAKRGVLPNPNQIRLAELRHIPLYIRRAHRGIQRRVEELEKLVEAES